MEKQGETSHSSSSRISPPTLRLRSPPSSIYESTIITTNDDHDNDDNHQNYQHHDQRPDDHPYISTPKKDRNEEVPSASLVSTPQTPGLVWARRTRDAGGDTRAYRMGKDKAGWEHLPLNILHLILGYTIDQPLPQNCLNSAWMDKPRCHEIVKAIQQRILLCQLRCICPGWKGAVDSHPFWPSYTLLLDPSRPHSSTLDDIFSASLIPSTPSFPTLFHRARFTTLKVCLACRLNHPARMGLYPAVPRRLTYTKRLGFAPTCAKHHLHTCSSCMREFGIESLSPTGHRRWISTAPSPAEGGIAIDKGLVPCSRGDIDEHGLPRYQDELICKGCRMSAIDRELQRQLVDCARGGPLRGMKEEWTTSGDIQNYINHSTDTASIQIERVLEERWLIQHTRYMELLDTAIELQDREASFKMAYITRNIIETDAQRDVRLKLEYELRGEDFKGYESAQDRMERNDLYNTWYLEAQSKKRGPREKGTTKALRLTSAGQWVIEDVSDESDEGEEEEEEVEEIRLNGLNVKWERKLRVGCINDWLNDRIRFGFWVSPSDEVAQLSILSQAQQASTIHTPFERISMYARNPFEKYANFTYTPPIAQVDSAGLIDLESHQHAADPFLPHDRLLDTLDWQYREKLRKKLSWPMVRLVDSILNWFEGDDEQAERHCATLPFSRVVTLLNDWRHWIPKDMLEALRKEADEKDEDDDLLEDDESSSHAGSDDHLHNSNNARESHSPKIELVKEERKDPTLAGYGIKTIEFASPQNHNVQVAPVDVTTRTNVTGVQGKDEISPKLGKRKSPVEEEDDIVSAADLPKKIRHAPNIQHGPPSAPVPTPPTAKSDIVLDTAAREVLPFPKQRDINGPTETLTLSATSEEIIISAVPSEIDSSVINLHSPSKAPALAKAPDSAERPLQDDAAEEDEGLFERSGTEESSHETIGTMPITPETEEDWTDMSNDYEMTDSSHDDMTTGLVGEGVLFPVKSAGIVSDTAPLSISLTSASNGNEQLAMPLPSDRRIASSMDNQTMHDQIEDEIEDEDEDQSLSDEDDDEDEDEDEEPVITEDSSDTDTSKAFGLIKDFITQHEDRIPFLPIPPGGEGESAKWNLGEGTEKIIMELWYEKREILRRCSCRICERGIIARYGVGVGAGGDGHHGNPARFQIRDLMMSPQKHVAY
ncbi:uncharacterized protein I303_105579 [Kwoniella dejecticola CBS 10117]|uniref:Uncharacterized protein n=1 Tax=Kwoniella dejecticola CBS 10117 TaxID=1296121 RepID=A0A1A6A234_9TREE|nr:uncharacterized protein I303_04978 [Kwoniella dejecticola CBS 10117]OBR84121.1 hypothetical protein I303_04978 [Kwoniella dejecticola CBS 10117]